MVEVAAEQALLAMSMPTARMILFILESAAQIVNGSAIIYGRVDDLHKLINFLVKNMLPEAFCS